MAQINNKHINIIKKILTFTLPILVFVFSFLMLSSIVGAQSFKHDEAVYLTKARSWIEGTPANEWRIYRPIGSAAVAWLILQFTSSESGVRMIGVALGALSLTFVYMLFRSVSNILVALSVVLMVGLSPIFLKESPQLLNDIPSAGLFIGALWFVWEHHKSKGKSKDIYLVALLGVLALYLRYGVAVWVGATALSSFFILAPQFSKSENASYTNLGITVVIFVLLLSPHLIQAFLLEGSPLGILTRAGEASRRPEYWGDAFVDYKDFLLTNKLGGRVLDVFAVLGLVFTPIALFFKKLRFQHEALPWLGVISLLTLIITSLSTHAEARYVFMPLVLLAGVGVTGIYVLIQAKTKVVANLVMGLFLFVTAFYGINHYNDAQEYLVSVEDSLFRDALAEAPQIIAGDSSSLKGCVVWSAAARPEISWYSKCNTLGIFDVERFERDYLIHLRKSHYTLVFTNTSSKQISLETSDEFGVQLTEIYRTGRRVSPTLGELVVYRIDKIEFKTETNAQVNYEMELTEQFDEPQVEEVSVEESPNQEEI